MQFGRTVTRCVLFTCGLLASLGSGSWSRADDPIDPSDPAVETVSPQQRQRRDPPGAYKLQITPHWYHDGTKFWYRNELKGNTTEFMVIDATSGTRTPAFDHGKLASALATALGRDVSGARLPFDSIEFADDDRTIRFSMADQKWQCDLNSYACEPAPAEVRKQDPATPPNPDSRRRFPGRLGGDSDRPIRSPDGSWVAYVKDANVFIRSGDNEIQLSQDGRSNESYGRLEWSPDSMSLVAWRITPGEQKEVHLIQSSPPGGGRAVLQSRPYALPGDAFTRFELSLFDIAERKQTKVAVDPVDFGTPRLKWRRDKHHFVYQKVDRGHQRLRVIEVDAQTGTHRDLIDEQSATFIWTAHTEDLKLNLINYLEACDDIIYVSERSGWRHLYLVDSQSGEWRSITSGEYVVRGIERIDEARRQLWFQASGRNPDQDPYFVHHYRVNFDGTGLVAVTEGNGDHSVQYSPDRHYVLDTYSRVDKPPVHELRRVEDTGSVVVCQVEGADIAELLAKGWKPPEVFVAKGRDGDTDIWGTINRPSNYDPTKQYPVIEDIYAGPQGSFVPKTFSATRRYGSLTDLGFIVAKIDGMGTANRSKAFHDVCWKNLKDAGLPDRIAWHRAVAERYSSYDISRVGIYGGSAGGQNAAAAVLFHPEFYKVAVAGCGCHDNRMDKASWNEQWMGHPVGPQYSESSNIDNAHRLQGKLFLIVGEMDTNVPPESTMRFVDALIKSGKDFDLLVVPGAGHGMGGAYGDRRMRDFFVRNLLGPTQASAGVTP